jgi:serine protease Do/serine protease DegQ
MARAGWTTAIWPALLALLLGLAINLSVVGQGRSALPYAIDGQKLPSLAPMLERTTPAVVNISTRGQLTVRSPLFEDPFFQRFFGNPGVERKAETQSLGSGVIVDADNGYILTNNHVIEDAIQIRVTLRDGRELDAEIIGRDPDTDIAVIKVPPKNLKAIELGDSARLRVGDFVVAIGNPFGLGQTVTSGIVSALGRSGLGIESYEDFIQTDASINPGNSGGALVDLKGRLVGLNTAILGAEGGGQGNIGIGFAIPINLVRDIMQQLVENGEVKRGRLGVEAQDLNADLAQAFELESRQGAIVTRVEQGSPAQRAGLQIGDVILRVNGRKVRSSLDIRNLVGLMRLGQQVEIEFLRGGKRRMVRVTVEALRVPSVDGGEIHVRLAGARIGSIREDDIRRGVSEYLQVLEVEEDSIAWFSGVRPEDIIVAINQRRATNLEQARAAAARSRGLLLTLQRGDRMLQLLLQ